MISSTKNIERGKRSRSPYTLKNIFRSMDDLHFCRKNLIQQLVLNKVKDLQQAIILPFLYTGQYIHYIWSSDALADPKMYKNALNI